MSKNVVLDGKSLTIQDVVHIARNKKSIKLADAATKRILTAQKVIEKVLRDKDIIYGITTGFGALRTKTIFDHTELLQKNLIYSHAAGMGEELKEDVTRASIALRINTLAKGNSGAQLESIEKLVTLLNRNILPILLEKGSVGASGDLAPLAHVALAMMGKGELNMRLPSGEVVDAHIALKKFNIEPASFKAKEGLAFTNGTNVMSGHATLLVWDALHLLELAEITTAMAVEAIKGVTAAFDERIHQARPYAGQIESARIIRNLLRGSKIAQPVHTVIPEIEMCPTERCKSSTFVCPNCQQTITTRGQGWQGRQLHICPHCKAQIDFVRCTDCNKQIMSRIKDVQNDYSIRCAPQVHGSARDTLYFVAKQIRIELNSVVDNPLIFPNTDNPDEFEILSGGNFHGESLAMVSDFLSIALTSVGNITERRIAKLLDKNHNHGLPSFLIENAGLNNGLMITQYTAANMASENKIYATPSVIDSIPTSANTEDYVSMGPVSVQKGEKLVDNMYRILAIALLTAAQAIELRLKIDDFDLDALGVGTRKVMEILKDKGFKLIKKDSQNPMYIHEKRMLEIVKDPEFVDTIYRAINIEPAWKKLIST